MSKYCLAGKIECFMFFSIPHSVGCRDLYCGENNITDAIVCPYPSRQRPVAKTINGLYPVIEPEPTAGPQMITVETSGITAATKAAFEQGRIAGINEGVERCKMAMRSCSQCELDKYTICRDRIAACKEPGGKNG